MNKQRRTTQHKRFVPSALTQIPLWGTSYTLKHYTTSLLGEDKIQKIQKELTN